MNEKIKNKFYSFIFFFLFFYFLNIYLDFYKNLRIFFIKKIHKNYDDIYIIKKYKIKLNIFYFNFCIY